MARHHISPSAAAATVATATPRRQHYAPSPVALILAAAARCDARTVERAMVEGADAIRTKDVRERIVEAARSYGVALPIEDPR